MKNLIYKMLTTSTGEALCDSVGLYGRHWEKNQKRSLKDFENEPVVSGSKENEDQTVSVFHYLTENAGLELDELCEGYNTLECKDWESDIYGVSKDQAKWLTAHGLNVLESFNSYNGESYLSQVIQGTYITTDGTDIPDYVLLQIHQGCDVRGGYTDAKLFKLTDDYITPEIYLLKENN